MMSIVMCVIIDMPIVIVTGVVAMDVPWAIFVVMSSHSVVIGLCIPFSV